MQSGKPVNDLVNFLNNSGNTSAMKAAVLQAIHNNRHGEQNRGSYGSPLTFDQALNLGLMGKRWMARRTTKVCLTSLIN